jgi:hypothetical protein
VLPERDAHFDKFSASQRRLRSTSILAVKLFHGGTQTFFKKDLDMIPDVFELKNPNLI